jgi:bifunctional ADP-heptose synthase (sugar kinase/adenylyltransferase)
LIGAAQVRSETVVFTCGCFDVLHVALWWKPMVGDHPDDRVEFSASVRALKESKRRTRRQ